ncbi:TlpA family protein disulfide reductase [Pseudarthrobacter oxydans]|uniref:TlpA family protein disulfide reductase n=1 Tax=Pseudarthrobacter oxydans TaxID=1671 RepID=UPI0031B5CF16
MRNLLALLLAAASAAALLVSLTSNPATREAGAGEDPALGTGFTALTSQGEQVSVPGSKPSVLFFFSIECGACGPGTRVLAEVQRSSPAAVNYVAVDIAPYETADQIREFLAGNGASSLAFASDTDTRLITAYGINQVSTAVVLDAAGTEVFRAVEPDAAELRTALAATGAG